MERIGNRCWQMSQILLTCFIFRQFLVAIFCIRMFLILFLNSLCKRHTISLLIALFRSIMPSGVNTKCNHIVDGLRDVQASSILLDDKFEVRLGSLSEVHSQEGDSHPKALTRFLRKPQYVLYQFYICFAFSC